MYKELLAQQQELFFKWGKDLYILFQKKRYPKKFNIISHWGNENQNHNDMYYFIPNKMSKKNVKENKCLQRYEEIGTIYIVGRNVKWFG